MTQITKDITYNGAKYPVRISYYAIKKFQEDTKKDLEEITNDISLLEVLLWYGLVAGHKVEGKELLLTKDDMEFVLDESMTQFNEIMQSFFPTPTEISDANKKK